MENTIDRPERLTRKQEAYNIGKELVEKYPGKLISKGGLKNMYDLPHVRACEIVNALEVNFGFIAEGRNLRIPKEIKQ